jgi:hypothetical protein
MIDEKSQRIICKTQHFTFVIVVVLVQIFPFFNAANYGFGSTLQQVYLWTLLSRKKPRPGGAQVAVQTSLGDWGKYSGYFVSSSYSVC